MINMMKIVKPPVFDSGMTDKERHAEMISYLFRRHWYDYYNAIDFLREQHIISKQQYETAKVLFEGMAPPELISKLN
jgi:uncharacterized protein YqgQ